MSRFLPLLLSLLAALPLPAGAGRSLPSPLQGWEDWATWDDRERGCPTPYSDSTKPLCLWPSALTLGVELTSGHFALDLTLYRQTWVRLPGSREVWPFTVLVDGQPVPVVEHGGGPAVRLLPGARRVEGTFRWPEIPQRITLPSEIGLLALTVEGKPVPAPTWDAQGTLWLKRGASSEEADKDFLATKIYAVLEDGIPLWLRTEVELIVSGKSREEEIGAILPQGWNLSSVESPLPVAVDDAGHLKAQVRAGKWTLHVDAFRTDNPKELRYAEGQKLAAPEELVAFRAKPDFRMLEIVGSPSIDVSQTTFPEKWRSLPVYRWETATPFHLEERQRGMGQQKSAGLAITRQLWLDDNGRGLTFLDTIAGQEQQLWRLDAAPGQELGSVRRGGVGQLITRNPQDGAPGVEIRTRQLDLTAIGRLERTREISATGWRADADSLRITLNLPPGWRLFALFGADWERGAWLTSWTLLDLFVLLLFALAVSRLWGFGAGALAFLALGLSYHEAAAPRFIWLVLLVPLALQRVVPAGWGRRLLEITKGGCLLVFLLILLPFLGRQIKQAIYPELEIMGETARAGGSSYSDLNAPGGAEPASAPAPEMAREAGKPMPKLASLYAPRGVVVPSQVDNLKYDDQAHIQTGPGVPEWTWRTVEFGWNGPVLATQKVRPVLISLGQERVLTVLRIALLLGLTVVLLGARRWGGTLFARRVPVSVSALVLGFWLTAAASGHAEIPEQQMLDKLRERLLEPSDAYPNAADIPSATLTLAGQHLTLEAEIHAAIRTAVPLPGGLPAWSPLSVAVDGQPAAALRRDGNFLWVVLEPGVHQVRVEGSLAAVTEWEWTFLLKPRQVKIEAPGWTVTGVRADGVPEPQVFFAKKQKEAAGAASYERQEVQTLAVIDRYLEFGLIWQVRTTVTRLSAKGKAIALRVPLLPGENVLTNTVVKDGFIQVRLGAQEESATWESGLAVANRLSLATHPEDTWVERWHLVVSPVWNVALAGLPPIFEANAAALVPVWQPWPGEGVQLAVSRPEAIPGATVTVNRATWEVSLGQRQRVSQLELALRCSLGQDFLLDLPAEAAITSLTRQGQALPVRREGARLIVPLQPGEQSVAVGWKMDAVLGSKFQLEPVRLPVESANFHAEVTVPENRWVLWAWGPRRGPAVRFWGILACSLLAAVALGRAASSPLRVWEWMLLAIGLTQVPLLAALFVVAWLFVLAWRGGEAPARLGRAGYNAVQIGILVATLIALIILIGAVGEGLLGRPEMFIEGNGSSQSVLRWYQGRCELALPQPGVVLISIWWYRVLMLLWALWLAASVVRWLHLGWTHFSRGGFLRPRPAVATVPPPLHRPVPPAV